MQAPALAARCMKKSRQTRHSLLASAMVAPRSTAANAGLSPAAPLTAAMTQSAGRGGALNDGAFARPAFGARPSQCILQLREASRIGNGGKPGPKLLGKLRESLDVGMSRQRFHLVALRRSPQQIHGAVADRPGGAKDGHRANGGTPQPCCYATEQRSCHHQTIRPRPTPSSPLRKKPNMPARTIAATKPSSRSSSPPCPEIRWSEPWTPKRSFHRRFQEIAQLGHHESAAPSIRIGDGLAETEYDKSRRYADASAPKPPIAPAHVFLGLTLGHSLGLPIPRPAK